MNVPCRRNLGRAVNRDERGLMPVCRRQGNIGSKLYDGQIGVINHDTTTFQPIVVDNILNELPKTLPMSQGEHGLLETISVFGPEEVVCRTKQGVRKQPLCRGGLARPGNARHKDNTHDDDRFRRKR